MSNNPRKSKRNKSNFKKAIPLAITCITLLLCALLTNTISKNYTYKINNLKTEIQTKSTNLSNLKAENKTMESDIENLNLLIKELENNLN